MCRLLGVVSSGPRSFGLLLEQAPRSLAMLSEKHRDGWGVAASRRGRGWAVRRSLLRAGADRAFLGWAGATLGELIVAHVRQRTRGEVRLENTHPFVASPWVFAHNGTIRDVAYLRASSSPERLRELRGDTDSELLFAFLLTQLDDAGAAGDRIDRALRIATKKLVSRPELGTASFILSNGDVLYAHRYGAPLHLLQRKPTLDGACESCPQGLPCIAVTTEPITDEPWLALSDGDLVRIERDPEPHWSQLRA
jgi:predicted glutamine amidotransferase